MNNFKKISHTALIYVENLGLLVIALSTVVAIAFEVYTMISNRFVTLADLLLLFIYLEVISMVAVYLKSGKLPVRMPLYIAMVALARYLILDMKNHGYMATVRYRRCSVVDCHYRISGSLWTL